MKAIKHVRRNTPAIAYDGQVTHTNSAGDPSKGLLTGVTIPVSEGRKVLQK